MIVSDLVRSHSNVSLTFAVLRRLVGLNVAMLIAILLEITINYLKTFGLDMRS